MGIGRMAGFYLVMSISFIGPIILFVVFDWLDRRREKKQWEDKR